MSIESLIEGGEVLIASQKIIVDFLGPSVEATLLKTVGDNWLLTVNSYRRGRKGQEDLERRDDLTIPWDLPDLLWAVRDFWHHFRNLIWNRCRRSGIDPLEIKRKLETLSGLADLLRDLRNRGAHPAPASFALQDRDLFLLLAEQLLRDFELDEAASKIYSLYKTFGRLARRDSDAANDAEHESVALVLSALNSQLEDIKRQGVTEAALRAIATRIETRFLNAPIDEVLRYVDGFIEAAVREEQERRRLSGQFPDRDSLRKAARELLDAGRLDEVSSPFDIALQHRRIVQTEQAFKEITKDVQLLEDAANYDCLVFNIEKAADRYMECARILCPGDDMGQTKYLLQTAFNLAPIGFLSNNYAPRLIAITLFRSLIQVVDRSSSPHEWAEIQYSLGLALASIGQRDFDTKRLDEGISCYRKALLVCSRSNHPFHWAFVQCYLGDALSCRGDREIGAKRLKEAIVALQNALTIFTFEDSPGEWATTQNNLGNAFARLSTRAHTLSNLRAAAQAYSAALKWRTRQKTPVEWAMTQMNLAFTLIELGKQENNTAHVEKAVSLLRLVLQENIFERVPFLSAAAQTGLGNALKALGVREGSVPLLEEAIGAHRTSIQIYDRRRAPHDWATVQLNLGLTLLQLGTLESGRARLDEAVIALQEALSGQSREGAPKNWVHTQIALGEAFYLLATRFNSVAAAERSSEAYREALKVGSFVRMPKRWMSFQHQLIVIDRLIADLRSRSE